MKTIPRLKTDLLDFGRWNGYTIEQVFIGRPFLLPSEIEVIKKDLLDLKHENRVIFDKLFPDDLREFKIHVPVDSQLKIAELVGITDEFLDKNTIAKVSDFNRGKPSYIEWCISNINYFSLEPSELNDLIKFGYYSCEFIQVSDIRRTNNELSFDLRLDSTLKKSVFSSDAILLNQSKSNSRL